eukprot:2053970-Prorocentrum_lima.AAC.1
MPLEIHLRSTASPRVVVVSVLRGVRRCGYSHCRFSLLPRTIATSSVSQWWEKKPPRTAVLNE